MLDPGHDTRIVVAFGKAAVNKYPPVEGYRCFDALYLVLIKSSQHPCYSLLPVFAPRYDLCQERVIINRDFIIRRYPRFNPDSGSCRFNKLPYVTYRRKKSLRILRRDPAFDGSPVYTDILLAHA